jgi:hypothetical protein
VTEFEVRTADLRALNSMTKYPSIPTYHALDPRNGGLTDQCVQFRGEVIATEKVDGTNARVILPPDGSYLIGSREELLYAKGDLIGNPSQGIVDALRRWVDDLVLPVLDRTVRVLFLEVYGGKIGGQAKQYTADPKTVGWRLFDVALVDYDAVAARPSEEISRWRDNGGQTFLDETELQDVPSMTGLQLTPRLFKRDADALPTDIEGMHKLLVNELPRTAAALDGSAGGRAEGIVFRSAHRTVIAKARFQDYERTMRRRNR